MGARAPSPVSLACYEQLAEQRLDANAWAYFSGGAADEITVRWEDRSLGVQPLADKLTRQKPYDASLEELIFLAVTASDSMAADVLLAHVGGPPAVKAFLEK